MTSNLLLFHREGIYGTLLKLNDCKGQKVTQKKKQVRTLRRPDFSELNTKLWVEKQSAEKQRANGSVLRFDLGLCFGADYLTFGVIKCSEMCRLLQFVDQVGII